LCLAGGRAAAFDVGAHVRAAFGATRLTGPLAVRENRAGLRRAATEVRPASPCRRRGRLPAPARSFIPTNDGERPAGRRPPRRNARAREKEAPPRRGRARGQL
jgi:hypothetical protein